MPAFKNVGITDEDIIVHLFTDPGTNIVAIIEHTNNKNTKASPVKFELTIRLVRPATTTLPIFEYLKILINVEPTKIYTKVFPIPFKL